MRAYSTSRSSAVTLIFTLQAGATHATRLLEFRRGLQSTNATVTADRGTFQRSTGGTTPTPVTEDKFSSRSPANSGQIQVAWVANPTLSGSALLILYNGYRQTDAWNATWRPPRPWAAPLLIEAEQADAREALDTGGQPAYALVFGESLAEAYAGQRLHRRPRQGSLYSYRNAATKAALATGIGKGGRSDENWSVVVRLGRPSRGVQNWLSFYGTAPAPEERLAPATVVGAEYPYYMEV